MFVSSNAQQRSESPGVQGRESGDRGWLVCHQSPCSEQNTSSSFQNLISFARTQGNIQTKNTGLQKQWADSEKDNTEKQTLKEETLSFPEAGSGQHPERLLSGEALVFAFLLQRVQSVLTEGSSDEETEAQEWELRPGGTASRQHVESGPPGAENLLPVHPPLHQLHAAQLIHGDKGCPGQVHLRMKSPVSPMYTE